MSAPRETQVGRLIRLGFRDPSAAVVALTAARLWVDGAPVDEQAGVVVTAVGEAPDPDLAAMALASPNVGVA